MSAHPSRKQTMTFAKNIGAAGVIASAMLVSQAAQAAEPFVNPDWANSA